MLSKEGPLVVEKSNLNKQKGILTRLFLSFDSLPILLTLTVISVTIVLFRMKGVEQSYKHNKIIKKIKSTSFVNKELKANKAKKLSIDNLRRLARKFKFTEPKEKQIIIIP